MLRSVGRQQSLSSECGLARARQNGTKLGRRRVKPSVEATIRELRAKGDGILKIARTLGVGTSVVQRVVLETA
jgi:transposase-like protein